MLKFLDNRKGQKASKSPIKFKPAMAYGISIEAPQEFQTPYTIVHEATYINPYVEFEHEREQKLPSEKLSHVRPSWTKKTNLQMVEEHKILSSQTQDLQSSQISRYRKSYRDEFDNTQGRFKIMRGEFTDFIEKNNRYKSVGPIHGKERTIERITHTKQSVWLKPDLTSSDMSSKVLYNTYFDLMRESKIKGSLQRAESTISNNSKLISEKGRIRENRQKMNESFARNLELRKHSLNLNKWQLPKLQSEMLPRYNPFKIKSMEVRPEDDQIKDIDKFESKLHRQFR